MKMPDVKNYNNTLVVLDALALLGLFLICAKWAPLWPAIIVGFLTLAGIVYLFTRLK